MWKNTSLLIIFGICLGLVLFPDYVSATAWDVSTASYEEKYKDISAQEATLTGVAFSSNGTFMYIIGVANTGVFQYTLGTDWDVSTASYASKSCDVSSETTEPQGIFIKSDGTKIYVVGDTGAIPDAVLQYTLSTPWDISTCSYDSKNKGVASEDGQPRGVAFSSNGTKMYIDGRANDKVFQYTLSTDWDVSTASYDSVSYTISGQTGESRDITFSTDGTKMYIVDDTGDIIYQYALANAWDISSASYNSKNYDVTTQDANPSGVTFPSDGSKMYVVGLASDSVYQYLLQAESSYEVAIINLEEIPTDPATFSPSQTYYYNATVCDTSGAGNITAVFFEWNGGSNATVSTYTAINGTCREYYTSKSPLGAGAYSYIWYVNDTTNSISDSENDTYTVNKASATFSLSASPSWSVSEGISSTITASATPSGTITLYKDGVIVSNPYTASLGYGTYNFTSVYEHANYTASPITKFLTVSSGGFGCSDTDTYAFRKEITSDGSLLNLNFTDLVNDNLVRSDLKDVYIDTSVVPNVWTNFTGGYYVVVNVTGISSFNVTFGNYIANNSYTNTTQSENTTAMTGYTEINPYYVLTFIEETDGMQQLPPDTNSTVVSLFCSGGVSSFEVENEKILVSSFDQLTDIKATVTYSATEIYYRNYVVASSLEYKYIYLVDANEHQVVQLLLTLQDYTGDFSGSALKIKKYLEGTLRTITEQEFDVENKVVVYLINGDKYQLYIDNGVEERSIGYLNVDPVDLDKTLVLYSVETTNMTVIENMTYSLTYNGQVIEFIWIDSGGQTDSVDFWVYNYTNETQVLFYSQSTNHSYVKFTYNVPIVNDTYITKWLVHHNIFGLNSTGRKDVLSYGEIYPAQFPLSSLVQYLGGNDVVWFALLIILPLPMLFTRRHAGIGALFLVAIVALFRYWHFISIPTNILAIGLMIAIFIEIINRRMYS